MTSHLGVSSDSNEPAAPHRRLKVLVHGINYAPELTGIGKYTGEMAEWLASRGYEVRVVAAPPYYPEWAIRPGYSSHRYQVELRMGVRILRTPLWVPTRASGIRRILHLGSFAIASVPALLAHWRWRPDLVWVTEPPLFCAPAVLAFAAMRGAKSWLHIQDYEVDAAFELGLLKGPRLRRAVGTIERWLMRRFDRVSTISLRMVERASSKGIEPGRLVLVPNWADISAIRPLESASPYRSELGIADDVIVALYSGNMGGKQGLELLADVALCMRDEPTIMFVFCGNGPARIGLMARCAGLANVKFLDLQPVERLGDLLGLADIHLLPQRADAADLVMPSKLTGMLSSGRPVVAGANPHTELGRVAMQCGIAVPPEDALAFSEAVVALAFDPQRRRTLGAEARVYAERELALNSVLERFEADLLSCIGH